MKEARDLRDNKKGKSGKQAGDNLEQAFVKFSEIVNMVPGKHKAIPAVELISFCE